MVMVGGVRGVGKSDLLRYVQAEMPTMHVHYMSAELQGFAHETTGVDFFHHDVAIRDALREEYGQRILQRFRDRGGVTVLDSHYTDIRESPDKILHPAALLRAVSGFLLLDAPDEVVLKRRVGQQSKPRSLVIADIQAERASQRQAQQRLAATYRCPALLVDASGSREAAAVAFMGALQSVSQHLAEVERRTPGHACAKLAH